jgi:hypothetical protein
MGQDTYCVMGASAPVAFTFEIWPIYRDILFNSGLDETELSMLLITDFPSDGCHNLTYHIGEAFKKFDSPDNPITPEEFQACVGSLEADIRKYKWLPETKELLGMELQIMVEITCCHVRGLTRRENSHIFNQEESHSPASLAAKTREAFEKLTKVGIRENRISINNYIWDSQ